jgi:parvulin-like peptidyl-prolyl isomerase
LVAKAKEVKVKNNNNGSKGVKIYKVDNAQQKEEKKTRREKVIEKFLIVLIVILAIAAIFSAIQTFFPNLFGKFSLGGELAARVNGKTITMEQLNTEYNRLPDQYKYFITKEAFLAQIIDESLLIQEAEKQGVMVSDKELDENLNTFMQTSNLTQDKLDAVLKEKKLTYNELRALVKNQLMVDKLFEKSITSKINVTTDLARKYYDENPDTFKTPETVTVRHILIGLANRTAEEADVRANDVLKIIKDDKSNFCALVPQYSDDAGSVDNCGEYTFGKGQMVAEFESRAFNQSAGDVSIVKTDFGSHILWTINKTADKIMPFSEVVDQITKVLSDQQEKMLYSQLIADLRGKAKIVNYLEEKAKAEQAKQNATAQAQPQPTVIEPIETVAENKTTAETPVTEETEIKTEVTPPVVKETTTVVVQPQQPQLSFVDCLVAKEAILYGASWDSSTKTQKGYFGSDVSKIKYVECGVERDYRAQTADCDEAGIQAYPTWVVDGKKHLGIQSPEQLATLTGCKV